MNLDMFKNKLFAVSVFCGSFLFSPLQDTTLSSPFICKRYRVLSAAQTGLLMMAYSVTMGILAPFSGQLSDKIGSEFLCFMGLCVITVALLILSTLGVNTSLVVFLIGSITMSVGMAMFQSPNTSLIMSTVERSQTGVAGSINALGSQFGYGIWQFPCSTVLLYNIMSGHLGYTVMGFVEGEVQVFVAAMHRVYRFMALISAVGAVLTGLRWKNRKEHETEA